MTDIYIHAALDDVEPAVVHRLVLAAMRYVDEHLVMLRNVVVRRLTVPDNSLVVRGPDGSWMHGSTSYPITGYTIFVTVLMDYANASNVYGYDNIIPDDITVFSILEAADVPAGPLPQRSK